MDFLRRSDASKIAKDKTLVGFGAGVFGARTQHLLDGLIEFFVDNEKIKWNRKWEGQVPVVSPDNLINYKSSSIVIIICSEQYKLIHQQIKKILPGVEVYITPLLKDYEVFERLLNCSSKILVSAYGEAGGLYMVNGQTEQYELLRNGSFRGLLQCPRGTFVATEKGNIFEIISLNPFEMVERYCSEDIVQMHGLAFWKEENMIIAAEAENDRLVLLDSETFEIKSYIPITNKKHEYGRDNCHINDLAVRGNSVFVSMISRSGWWKKGVYDGCILEVDLTGQTNAIQLINDVLFPHSINFIDDSFISLESLTGKIINGRKQVVGQLGGFIRGLDYDKNLFYVGQARNRRLDEATKYIDTLSMDSGIYIFDAVSRMYRFIKMPEKCDVYSIVVLEKEVAKQ